MANISDAGGGGNGQAGPRTLEQALNDWRDAVIEVGAENGRSWTAVVTDVSNYPGFISASLGGSEVTVLDWSKPLTVGDPVIITKYDNSQASPFILEEYAAKSTAADTTGLYEFCFPDASTSPQATWYIGWAGSILATGVLGSASASLSVGGTSVGVGDAIAADSALDMTCTGTGKATVWVKIG